MFQNYPPSPKEPYEFQNLFSNFSQRTRLDENGNEF